MNYCLVENNTIIDGPRGLPRSWRNISGLDLLSPEKLKELGWLPCRIEEGNVDEKFIGSEFTITPEEVVETKLWRKYTEEEKAEINNQKAIQIRIERGKRLAETDWTQGKDIPEAISSKWVAYRQALRDITLQSDFPTNITWPSLPR